MNEDVTLYPDPDEPAGSLWVAPTPLVVDRAYPEEPHPRALATPAEIAWLATTFGCLCEDPDVEFTDDGEVVVWHSLGIRCPRYAGGFAPCN